MQKHNSFIFNKLIFKYLPYLLIISICSFFWACEVRMVNKIWSFFINAINSYNYELINQYVIYYIALKLSYLLFMRLYDFVWLYLRINLQINLLKQMFEIFLNNKKINFNTLYNVAKELSIIFSQYVNIIFNNFVAYIAILWFAFYSFYFIDFKILIAFLILFLTFIIGIFIVVFKGFDLSKKYTQSKINLFNYFLNVGSNAFYIHFYKNFEYERNLYYSKTNEYYQDSLNRDYLYFILHLVQTVICLIYEFFCLYVIVNLYFNNLISAGEVAEMYLFNKAVLRSLWEFSYDITKFIKLNQQISLLLTQVLEEPISIELKEIKTFNIEFKNVNFKYENSEQLILNNFNLIIPYGKKIAIIGKSGIGKSTLIKLLLNINLIESGEILIGNEKIDQLDIYKYFNIITQDIILFNRSFFDNIRYSNLNATLKEVENAAKLALIYDEIIEKGGFETLIEENSINISQGQKQRILIARMFLNNAPIIILDEATSSLDNKTQQYINSNILDYAKNKTLIIITHREEILEKMDQIISL